MKECRAYIDHDCDCGECRSNICPICDGVLGTDFAKWLEHTWPDGRLVRYHTRERWGHPDAYCGPTLFAGPMPQGFPVEGS